MAPPLFALTLEVGQSRNIFAPKGQKILIGSKKILKAVDQGDKVTLIGVRAGRTSVTIGPKSLDVVVLPPGQIQFASALQELLKNRKGLKVNPESTPLTVTGQLYVFEDWMEVAQLARDYGGQYRILARPTEAVLEESKKYFSKMILENQLGPLRLSEFLPLKVSVKANQAELKKARVLFEPFGIEVTQDKDLLRLKPLIKTSVILAEVSRKASSSLGIGWPTETEGSILPEISGPSRLMASLKALEAKGLGKVLASPTLSCRSGAKAEFHAGGEFPIRLSGFAKQSVQWKKHGVVLKVSPKADALGAIQISIETEVSLIDASQIVEGLPALKTNRVKSHFDLREKQTVAMSGLIQETWGKSRSGLFGLSQIPVLGALFRSEDFISSKSELVVFVTPEVVTDPLDQGFHWPKEWELNEL